LIRLPWASANIWHRARWPLMLCLAIVLLPLYQLVPLPPWIWTKLPGREVVAATFELLGGPRPWLPVSAAPTLTWLSVLSLLAPVTIFLGVVQLGHRERRRLSLIIIAFGVGSAFLGLLQIAQGPGSALRFFTVTNDSDAVGFFANRNHFAALLYVVLVFAAPWAIDISFKSGPLADVRSFQPTKILTLTAIFMVLVVLMAAEAMARSRAGIGLMMVAVVGLFALGFAQRRKAPGGTAKSEPNSATANAGVPNKVLLAAVTVAVLLAVQFSLYRIQDRFAADPLQDARIPFAHNTIRAALAFTPFGSGVGTFVPVYGMFEKASDTFGNVFANHAHDDWLEVWLETGVTGLVLLAGFGIWAGFRAAELWRPAPPGASGLDRSLSRAATLAIGLVLAHSSMDYPLRTGAMMAVFAFACALMVEPLGRSTDAAGAEAKSGRHSVPRQAARNFAPAAVASRSSAASTAPAAQAKGLSLRPMRQAGGRWGEGIEWPQEWGKPSAQKASADDGAQPTTTATNTDSDRSRR